MATLDVGSGHGGRRALDHSIPLIPFIDFLLCLVAFLLVTAVWSQMARLRADAQVPGKSEESASENVRELHVDAVGTSRFKLSWKQNGTIINTLDVEKKRVTQGDSGDFAFPELAAKITSEWSNNGQHRAPSDPKLDRAVLHIDNTAPFADLSAIMDALYATKRQVVANGAPANIPAFNVAFAVN